MSQSPGRAGSSSPGRESALWKRLVFGALVTLAVLFLLSMPFLQYGAVVGEEFSPDRFRRRTYNYWEIPFLHVQITPLNKQDRTGDMENYLINNKLVTPSNATRGRWDLVSLERGGVEAPPGDAAILCRYLDQRDDQGASIWLQWTKDHAQLAAVLWPAVAEAARRELYFLVPDLFHLAEQAAQPEALRRRIAAHLAERYEQLADVQQKLGNNDRAKLWLAAARQYRALTEAGQSERDAPLPAEKEEADADGSAP